MKILIITQYFWPENFRINDIAAEMVNRGHDVTVLTGKPNYPSGTLDEKFATCPSSYSSYEGARIDRVPMVLRGSSAIRLAINYLTFAFSASIKTIMHYRKNQFDVCFVYEVSPITVALPAIVLRKAHGLKFAMWVLDLWPDTLEALDIVKNKSLLRLLRKLVKYIYRNTDRLMLQSKAFFGSVKGLVPDIEDLTYLPSWSDIPEQGHIHDRAQEIDESKDFTVLYTGNVGQAQDFGTVLDAAEAIGPGNGIRFVIVGDGRMLDWVSDQCKKRKLLHVHLLGSFPIERMPSFFNSADALLVCLRPNPNFAMTIPAKVQGYLAAGRPILAMLNGEGARVIEEANAGLTCQAGDSAALVNIIEQMRAMSDNEKQQMGEAGRCYGERHFSRDRLMDQIEYSLLELSQIR